MKYKDVRVVRMPVISDDNHHYFFNGDTGFRAILAEDLPRAIHPMNSIVDDMLNQQNPDFYCSNCRDKDFPCDCYPF